MSSTSAGTLEAMRATVQHAIEHGPNTLRKAVLQQFVVEVRIESRRVVWPTFRLPLGGVRELSRMVGPAEHFVNPHPTIASAPIDLSEWAEPIERWRKGVG